MDQGFRNHQIVEPLNEPGHTDLTANVDFGFLSEAVNIEGLSFAHTIIRKSLKMSNAARASPLLIQRDFLQRMGLEVRVEKLLKSASPQRQSDITSATQRLIDLTGMGKQYKVMAVTPKHLSPTPYPFV